MDVVHGKILKCHAAASLLKLLASVRRRRSRGKHSAPTPYEQTTALARHCGDIHPLDPSATASLRPVSAGNPEGPDAESAVSLRDLLSVPPLGLRLRAVPERADALVRWAHSTELIDPRPYLSGQELVLTVGTSLQDDQRCRDFVDHLLDAKVTALGYGVGDVTEDIPPALLHACQERGLPLLEVPAGVPFQAITELLADRRAEAHTARSRRVQRLASRLLDAISVDQPMDELVQIVQDDIGGHLEFLDGVLTWSPVTDSDVRPARETMEHLTAILAVRQHEVDAEVANRRAEVGRLLELVLQGRADPEVLQYPLEAAGIATQRSLVVAVWPPRTGGLLAPHLSPCLVAELSECTVTVSGEPQQVTETVQALSLPCGLGETAPLAQLRRVLPPAMAALRLARHRGAPVSYRDLASFEGLLEQQPPERLAPFSEKLIVPLVDHDRQHGAALVETLRTFLENDGSVNATAKQLFLHVNSLRHRLRRIQELTGAHPQVFDERVSLAIGLWAWDRRPRGRR
jgi:DNA-binding PucR family transcriptional regulator